MLPNISTATVHRWGTGHKRCPANARRTNVSPWVRTSGGGRLGDLRTRTPVAGHLLHSSARPLAWGGGAPPSSTLFIARSRGPLSAGWAPALRRLAAGVPPPPSWRQTTGRAGGCCRSVALVRRGAGMPNVPRGAAVPNPPSHRGACGALSVSVCRANPKAWQLGVLLQSLGLGAVLWRREKCCPHI